MVPVEQMSNSNGNLVNVSPLLELLRAAIWTGILADDDPVSVVLIAPQESAKTEMLKYFRGTRSLEFFSDLTSYGIYEFKSEIENEKLRHIVILDLVRIMSHPRTTSERTIQTIASLIEDGQMTVADGGGVSWRNEKLVLPRIGSLMGVTPEIYYRKRKMFRDTGFMSRFLPVRYTFSDSTAKQVHFAIRNGNKKPEPHPLILPEKRMKAVIPDKIAKLVQNSAYDLGHQESTWGFRWHRSLRALIKAHAISENRFNVEESDYIKLCQWFEFFKGVVEL